jgi:hypothetical protein
VSRCEKKLLSAIEEFTEGTPQTDDVTFMIAEKLKARIARPETATAHASAT